MAQDRDHRLGKASAALERDAALERVGRTRRWMLAAAAGLTAALAALASALVPGKSLGAKSHIASITPTRTGSGAPSTGTPSLPPPAGAAALGLHGAAPQSSEDSSNSGSSSAGNSGAGNSGAGNSGSGNSGAAAAQPAPAPAPTPAPAPSGNSGAAVSGGS